MPVFLLTSAAAEPSGLLETVDKFGINIYDLVAQAICFLVLALVLNKFVFRPIMKAVEQRRKESEDLAANTEKIRAELKAIEDSREGILKKAYEQAEKLMARTREEAENLREQEKIRTEQLVSRMIAKAGEEALSNQQRLKYELKNDMAEVIVRLTGILCQKELGGEDRKRLFDSALESISASSPGGGDPGTGAAR